jgi:hypothetical protein
MKSKKSVEGCPCITIWTRGKPDSFCYPGELYFDVDEHSLRIFKEEDNSMVGFHPIDTIFAVRHLGI